MMLWDAKFHSACGKIKKISRYFDTGLFNPKSIRVSTSKVKTELDYELMSENDLVYEFYMHLTKFSIELKSDPSIWIEVREGGRIRWYHVIVEQDCGLREGSLDAQDILEQIIDEKDKETFLFNLDLFV